MNTPHKTKDHLSVPKILTWLISNLCGTPEVVYLEVTKWKPSTLFSHVKTKMNLYSSDILKLYF